MSHPAPTPASTSPFVGNERSFRTGEKMPTSTLPAASDGPPSGAGAPRRWRRIVLSALATLLLLVLAAALATGGQPA